MRVYNKRPSGLTPGELGAYRTANPAAAAFGAARFVVALVLIALVGTGPGLVLFVVGLALLATVVPTLRASSNLAIVRPALVLTSRPKWDGTVRNVWNLDAGPVARPGEMVKLATSLANALDEELGESRTAFDEMGDFRGDTRAAVLNADAHAPGQIAWATDGAPTIATKRDTSGVWLRIERADPTAQDSALKVTVVADVGPATDAVHVAAARSHEGIDRSGNSLPGECV